MSQPFETQDFFLATYLIASGQTMQRVRLDPVARSAKESEHFLFRATGKLNALVEAYESGAARVSPRAFGECVVELRHRIRAERRQAN